MDNYEDIWEQTIDNLEDDPWDSYDDEDLDEDLLDEDLLDEDLLDDSLDTDNFYGD